LKSTSKSKIAELGLLLVTIIWGSAFVVVKNTIAAIPPNYLVAIRFFLAAALMCICFFPRLKKINRTCIIGGLFIAVPAYLGYFLQTVGLLYTTAGNSAFLTAVYVVMVPFFYWLIRHKHPDKFNISAAVICLIGIGFISLNTNFSMNYGDFLSLVCGLAFAAQIVAVSIFTEKCDPILLALTQFLFTAVFALIVALFTESFPAHIEADSVYALIYVGVFSTMIALTLQNICQKYIITSKASLIMSLESVFGCVFGIIFLQEQFTTKKTIGFLLVLVAMILSETKLSFLKRNNASTDKTNQ
jgi:drug/metabolite transporter (DMT)-like permease